MKHIPEGTPTQVAHPAKAVVRTVFAMVVAFAAMWPLIVEAAGLGAEAWVATSITIAGAITRIMALPAVNGFIERFLPFLATGVANEPGKHDSPYYTDQGMDVQHVGEVEEG